MARGFLSPPFVVALLLKSGGGALTCVAHLAADCRTGQSAGWAYSADGLYWRPESRCGRGNGDGVREGEPSVGCAVAAGINSGGLVAPGDIGAVGRYAIHYSSCRIKYRDGTWDESGGRIICNSDACETHEAQVADMSLDGNLHDAA